MIAIKLHYRVMLWLLLTLAPTAILVDQFIEVQQDIAAEGNPFERQLHCLYRSKLSNELHRRVVRRNDCLVEVEGNLYRVEPAHVGAVWLRPLDSPN